MITTSNETLTLYAADGRPKIAHLIEQRSDIGAVSCLKYARLTDGSLLSFVDDNTFLNLHTEELLHRRR
jgi:hypothetical protein